MNPKSVVHSYLLATHKRSRPQMLAPRSSGQPLERQGVTMKAPTENSKEPKAKKPATALDRPGKKAANKVPENAENFEHVLRRITIEKTRSKKSP